MTGETVGLKGDSQLKGESTLWPCGGLRFGAGTGGLFPFGGLREDMSYIGDSQGYIGNVK